MRKFVEIRRVLRRLLVAGVAYCTLSMGAQAVVIDNTYLFLGNLKDSPSLSTGTVNNQTLKPVDYAGESPGNTFSNDTIAVLNSNGSTSNCGTKQIYHVVTRSGVQSTVGLGTDYSEYSITMLAKLDTLGSWKRWLDFSDGTLDSGIYALNNDLNFYPNGNVFTSAFAAGKYSLITLTRSSSGTISVYIGATKAATYNDAAGLYKVPASGDIIFIRDNVSGPATGETTGANIAYINVSNFLKTDVQIANIADNICTVATTSKIALNKVLGDGRLAPSDQFTLQIKNASNTVVNATASSTTTGAGATVDIATGTTGSFTASGGQTYTLTEAGAGGTNISSYLSSIACTNASTGSTTVLPRGQIVGGSSFSLTPAILDDIRCTITNTQRPPVLRFTAALGTPRQGANDQFTVAIADGSGTLVSSSTNSTSAGTGSQTTAGKGTTDFYTATPGSTYTLQETMAAGSPSALSQYGKKVVCTNARSAGLNVASITTLGQSMAPLAGDVIDCVVTNTAIPTLVLNQISHLGIGSFSYTGNNGWGTQTVSTTSADGAGTPTAAQALNQANIDTTLSASLAAGWSLRSVACVDNNASVNGNSGTFGVVSGGTLSLPAAKILSNSQLTCTVIADLGPTLTVIKLVNGTPSRVNANDRFTIGLSSNSIAGRASLPTACLVGTSSTGTSLTCTTDNSASAATVAAQVATFALVADGSTTYTLSDAMGAGSGSALNVYKTNFSCSVSNIASVTTKGNAGPILAASPVALPAKALTLTPTGSPLASSYTIRPGSADQIVCTFENQAAVAKLTVKKIATGGLGSFTFNGTSANANGFSTNSSYTVSTTSSAAASGDTVNLLQTNALTEILEVSKSGWSLRSVACIDANASATGNPGTFGALNSGVLSIPANRVLPASDLQCTFANEYVGYGVSGKIILDDGAGNGTAHDGVQNGAESALAGVLVRLSNCAGQVYSTATTAADGSFFLSLKDAPTGQDVCVQQAPSSSYSLVSVKAGSTGASFDNATAALHLSAAPGTDYTGVVFGNILKSTLTRNNVGQVVASNTQTYTHTFTAGTTGSVSFGITDSSPGGSPWSSVLYLDSDCSGKLSSSSKVLSLPQTTKVGDRICLIVKVMAPATAAPGTANTGVLTATQTLSLPTLSPNTAQTGLENFDLSTVTVGGVLTLHKEFRILSNCPSDGASSLALASPFASTGVALPGQVIEYRLQFENTAAAAVTAVRIFDVVPVYSTLEQAFCISAPTRGLIGCSVATPANVASGNPVSWTLADASTAVTGLQPTDKGLVGLCVRIQQ